MEGDLTLAVLCSVTTTSFAAMPVNYLWSDTQTLSPSMIMSKSSRKLAVRSMMLFLPCQFCRPGYNYFINVPLWKIEQNAYILLQFLLLPSYKKKIKLCLPAPSHNTVSNSFLHPVFCPLVVSQHNLINFLWTKAEGVSCSLGLSVLWDWEALTCHYLSIPQPRRKDYFCCCRR